VPADAIVKQLSSSRTQQREDMLEVRRGTRRAAKRRRIQWSSPGGEEKQRRDTAAGLEATRAEVLMWQPVAREVEYRPQEKRRDSRPAHSAGGRTRGHMERDDHGRLPSRSSLPRSPRYVRVADLGSGCLVCARTVEIQDSSACSSARRVSSHPVAIAPVSLKRVSSSVSGFLTDAPAATAAATPPRRRAPRRKVC